MARSAPSFTQAAHFSALPAVANTLWPKAFTIWIAATPMPLDPPCTRKDSPGLMAARSNTLLHTVKKVSGKDAASTGVMPLGIGRRSEEHTSELQSHHELVCRLLLEKK